MTFSGHMIKYSRGYAGAALAGALIVALKCNEQPDPFLNIPFIPSVPAEGLLSTDKVKARWNMPSRAEVARICAPFNLRQILQDNPPPPGCGLFCMFTAGSANHDFNTLYISAVTSPMLKSYLTSQGSDARQDGNRYYLDEQGFLTASPSDPYVRMEIASLRIFYNPAPKPGVYEYIAPMVFSFDAGDPFSQSGINSGDYIINKFTNEPTGWLAARAKKNNLAALGLDFDAPVVDVAEQAKAELLWGAKIRLAFLKQLDKIKMADNYTFQYRYAPAPVAVSPAP